LIDSERLENIGNMIEQAVKADQRLDSISAGIDSLLPGVTAAIVFQAKQWSHGKEGLNPQSHPA
jgi:hypothetical protein